MLYIKIIAFVIAKENTPRISPGYVIFEQFYIFNMVVDRFSVKYLHNLRSLKAGHGLTFKDNALVN